MDTDKIVQIANQMTNDDLCRLMGMLAGRCFVFVEFEGQNRGECSEIDHVCMNGSQVQLGVKIESQS